ncbi:LptF/LptG family permease [Niveispirillum lacus]|uniref:LptF/LptG family permease n=1 Tax=Niveispirillum lacus TaxID=1981099 RepID=UPI0013FDF1FF|nr:LptF/LptG family permease [Niveispirillum lacus]
MNGVVPPPDRHYKLHSTRLIDRYILAETLKPLFASLLVVLVALLMERLLRLFDLLANHGGPFDMVIRLVANLVPHYLGLALPAAFFISMFIIVARMGEDNELDALQSAGLSVPRIARSFVALGMALMVFSIILFGYLQPYGRYGYSAIYHMVVNAAWNATVPQASFVDAGEGVTISADMVDVTGRRLEKVFVQQDRDNGERWVTTAVTGALAASPDRQRVLLTLHDGVQVRLLPDGRRQVMEFAELTLDKPFRMVTEPFRERGGSERELTLHELWSEMHDPQSILPHAKVASELHARLARALSLPLLPLLAVPMGMAAKRARRGQGIALATVILILYHHLVQLGESLGDVGRLSPVVGIWVPFALFSLLCAWLFHRADIRPGENPFAAMFDTIDAATGFVKRLFRRRRKKPEGGRP